MKRSELEDAVVIDSHGASVRLGSLLEGPALLIFLRHWGCVECSLLMAALGPRLGELSTLGVAVVMVGVGSVEGLGDFLGRYRLEGADLRVVTDPTLQTHRAAGLQRGLLQTLGPRARWAAVKGFLSGHVGAIGDGDLLQMGGAILLDGQGEIRWRHDNRRLGDVAPVTGLMDAVLRLRAEEVEWGT